MKIYHKLLVALLLGLGVFAAPGLPAQAYFNSPLAENPNYRPVNFGLGYEVYVDLSSLKTVEDNGREWVFTVNIFNSQEDSGKIAGTHTITYKIDSGKQAWIYEENFHSWTVIPMSKRIQHGQLADYVTVNLCYKEKTGKYLNDYNNYVTGMQRYYRGPQAPVK